MPALRVVETDPKAIALLTIEENVDNIERIAAGLVTLSEMLRHPADEVTESEFFVEGVSFLVGTIADSLLDKTCNAQRAFAKLNIREHHG